MTSLMFSHVDHDEFVEKDGIFPFLNIKTFFLIVIIIIVISYHVSKKSIPFFNKLI